MTSLRFRWDADASAPQVAGPVATAGAWSVIADATLYYRDDLRQRCGVGREVDDAAALIAAALHAGGDAALDWLEGDFAFVAWHAGRRQVLAARDFGGKRTLHHAFHGGALHVASGVDALLAGGALPRTLDLTTLCTVAAGMWAHADATIYTAIRELQAGHRLEWQVGGAPKVSRAWFPPGDIATRDRDFDGAAIELRRLLDAAVRERLSPSGPTAISLSGGWDSSAVYATAKALDADVAPVSISYPVGDPGREDELIGAIVTQWNDQPSFLDIADIPLAKDFEREAAQRPGPFAHVYEHWNRALARRAQERGATVLLDGIGGDQLFQCSDVYLADLLRTGQWLTLQRELRTRGGEDGWARTAYRWALRPNLPTSLSDRIATARGFAPPPHYLDRLPPVWFRRDFLRGHGVMERELGARPPRRAKSHVLAETQMYLTFPFYPRMFSQLAQFARDAGVEARSPLLDARVVAFAAQRPWSDRVRGRETKRLLRQAMRGRLPESVLAPRPHRTGTTNAYFLRELRRRAWPVAESVLPAMRLVEIGMIEPTRYRRAWEHVLRHDDDELAGRLFFTLHAELWLRTHLA